MLFQKIKRYLLYQSYFLILKLLFLIDDRKFFKVIKRNLYAGTHLLQFILNNFLKMLY